MSLVQRLFGPKALKMSDGDLLAGAVELLGRVEATGLAHRRRALDQLKRRGRLYLPVLRRGRPLHRRLREVVRALAWSPPPEVAVLDLEPVADLTDLVETARGLEAEAVAVGPAAAAAESDVISEVEAELALIDAPDLVVVVIAGSPAFCVRRSFLLDVAAEVVSDEPADRIGVALERLARDRGLGVALL